MPDVMENTQPETAQRDMEHSGPLLGPDFSSDMRSQWDKIQVAFVDAPREAVKEADELVVAATKKLADSFAEERNRLEQRWSSGGDVSTEDLRQALQKYRAFFNRLLAV